jgi:hypothetical protein
MDVTKILLIAILAFAILIVGCSSELTEEEQSELDAELEQLSDDDLLDLAAGNSDSAISGEAIRSRYGNRISKTSRKRVRKSAKRVISQRIGNLQKENIDDIDFRTNVPRSRIDTSVPTITDSEIGGGPCLCRVNEETSGVRQSILNSEKAPKIIRCGSWFVLPVGEKEIVGGTFISPDLVLNNSQHLCQDARRIECLYDATLRNNAAPRQCVMDIDYYIETGTCPYLPSHSACSGDTVTCYIGQEQIFTAVCKECERLPGLPQGQHRQYRCGGVQADGMSG